MTTNRGSSDVCLSADWQAILFGGTILEDEDSLIEKVLCSAKVFDSLADLVPLNLIVKDASGRRVYANQQYLDLQRVDQQELLGKTDFDLFPESIARKYYDDDQQVLRTGCVLRGVEEWPSLEAIKERERFESDELEISRFVEYRTYQGAPESFDDYGKA